MLSDNVSVHRTYFKLTKSVKFRFKHKQLMSLSWCTFFKLSGKFVPSEIIAIRIEFRVQALILYVYKNY